MTRNFSGLFLCLLSLLPAPPSVAQDAGQMRPAFDAWLATDANNQAFARFQNFLRQEGVTDVVPDWTLTRTASSWKSCKAPPFEVAPQDLWPRVAKTLKFIKAEVRPITGPLKAASGYRNPALNACAKGAPLGAHPGNWALDLVPDTAVDRPTLIRQMCLVHRRKGQAHDVGLGFYSGQRFHIDTMRFRKWGPDGKGASSPCNSV